MESLYKNGKAVMGFLVIVLIFSLSGNEKLTERMVLLVLLGMVLINSEKFLSFLNIFN